MTTAQLIGNIRDGFHRQAKERREIGSTAIQAAVLLLILVCIVTIFAVLHFTTPEPSADYGQYDRKDITSLVFQATK